MKVTKNKIKQLQTGKKIHDGRGLYFFKKGDKGRWSFRYQRDGKCHEMGCGPYPEISIPMARERRESYKKMLSCGLDPITEKRKEEAKKKVIYTNRFSELAKDFIEEKHFQLFMKSLSIIQKALESDDISLKDKAMIVQGT